MPRPRRSSRRNYNRIAGSGSNGSQDDDDADPGLVGVLPVTPLNAVINAALNEDGVGTSSSSSSRRLGVVSVISSNDVVNNNPSHPSSSTAAAAATAIVTNEINIVVMDAAQHKFKIASDASWTIYQFKQANSHITRVPPHSQRLIHMGKLLNDNATLADCGIRTNGQIVHLFPKPNVVINNNNTTLHGGTISTSLVGTTTTTRSGGGLVVGDDNNNDEENQEADGAGGGAHVPQIILNPDEASRRSQILILSSQEIFEAQHRVKIFSFLLMIISSMELLTLMTLFVGMNVDESQQQEGGEGGGPYSMNHEIPPGNPTDIPPTLPNSGGSSSTDYNNMIRTWQDSDYFDTIISAFGLYVSLLGIKATTENTLHLARQYLTCLTVAGLGSNCYYYYLNVNAQQKQAEARGGGGGDGDIDISVVHTTAFVGILLPISIWILCIVRAYQFHMLIREAEVEAQQRTASNSYGGGGGGGVVESTIDNRNVAEGGEGDVEYDTSLRTLSYGSEDLELEVERGVST